MPSKGIRVPDAVILRADREAEEEVVVELRPTTTTKRAVLRAPQAVRILPLEGTYVVERDIRRWGDPVLRTRCDEVTVFDESIATLCKDLLDTVTAREGRAGLAANQIGVSLRAFSWFIDGTAGVVVNPRLAATDGEQEGDEGCLSLPGLWYPLRRAEYAAVDGVDARGQSIKVEGTGLMARCLQHECDHLDGKLYVDRLERSLRRQALQHLNG